MTLLMLVAILLPAVGGILLPFMKFSERSKKLHYVLSCMVIDSVLVTILLFTPDTTITILTITPVLTAVLRADALSKLFMAIASYGFLLTGIFAFRYMEGEESEKTFSENTFWLFYLGSLSALIGMDLSANLVTMYFFFELITLMSMPLVLFERTDASIRAALKYLFYSVAGAFMALFAIITLSVYAGANEFAAGGILDPVKSEGHTLLLQIAVLTGVIGFGAKAGMYPLHGWLPTAHPEAPAPASAVLSAIIAKAGVLAILRVIFFTAGPSLIAGTVFQNILLWLSIFTVFLGSMMAYREKIFKKRLAFSTVSQISYALFGFFLLSPEGVTGGIMQVIFHAIVKICLFLTAGSMIHNYHYHNVDELTGIAKKMPKTMIAYTMASLSLIGIPPFAGFISKWYLAEGSLASELPVISLVGPIVLLVSALLTAGYLLPITTRGFFPGKDFEDPKEQKEGGLLMVVPIAILAALSLIFGLFGGLFDSMYQAIVNCMF